MATEERIVFFHVGLPKTASTFLQRRVFPHLENIYYVKKHDFRRHHKLAAQSGKSRILLSVEFNPHPGDSDGEEKLATVKESYDSVFPIIVLRKHSSWIKSRYKYHLRKHGTYSPEAFVDPSTRLGGEMRRFLHYYPKIELLEKTYGHTPLVLFQEEIKKHPFRAIQAIADYTGATFEERKIKIAVVKKAYEEKPLKWVLLFNRAYPFFPKKIHPKFLRKTYKKVSQLLLHTVAFFGRFLHDPQKGKALIPDETLQLIDREYRQDWEQCMAYAEKQRKVHL
ncbi:MAG: hypothetical protein U5L09_13245 [Bacteroidales bacterium]|nr:hypothetical protein [Bacteroidales bacterium]